MKIEISRPPSRCEVSVCLQRSRSTVGSRNGIGICQVGDDVLQELWEQFWLSVRDSEVMVFWLKASRVQVGLQVTGQRRGDVVQEDGFPRVHP